MNNFNFKFQRTWDRIPAMMRPPPEYTFLYFLRALKNDIAVMIQSMGGVSLPDAFEIAIRAENNLIQLVNLLLGHQCLYFQIFIQISLCKYHLLHLFQWF